MYRHRSTLGIVSLLLRSCGGFVRCEDDDNDAGGTFVLLLMLLLLLLLLFDATAIFFIQFVLFSEAAPPPEDGARRTLVGSFVGVFELPSGSPRYIPIKFHNRFCTIFTPEYTNTSQSS